MSSIRPRDARERASRTLVALFLWVEVLDELVDGVMSAAWPTIRDDLALSYTEIGLLLGVPMVLGNLLEPVLSIAADLGWRRRICLGGGLAFGACCAAAALADSFTTMLVAMLVMFPASGAFVGLAQLQLVELDRARSSRQLVLWTVAGCAGALLGPVALVAGIAGWRLLMMVITGGFVVGVVALAVVWRESPRAPAAARRRRTLREQLRTVRAAARRREVWRALLLLLAADLMLDVFASLLALYVVDGLGASTAMGGAAVLVFVAAMLAGNLALLPLIGERVAPERLIRVTTGIALVLLAALLTTNRVEVALGLAAGIGLVVAGWYPVLKAALFDAMPDHGGSALALSSVSASLFGVVPVVLGAIATAAGIEAALACLAAGPITLWLLMPRCAEDHG